MLHVRMERVRPHLGEDRFFAISVSEDMFGAWVVERRSGRGGCDGECRSASFPDYAGACEAARIACREQIARGYRIVADAQSVLPLDLLPPEDSQTRILRAASALEKILDGLPGHRDSRMGRIAASLASACRIRAAFGPACPAAAEQTRAEWLIDDTDHRVRARIFQLLDELVTGVLTDGDEHAVFRMIQAASAQVPASDVVTVVPRTKHGLLDQTIAGVFARDAELSELSLDLAGHGIRYVGQLVQLGLDDLLGVTGGRRGEIGRLEDRLRAMGLNLGSKTPRWRVPGQAIPGAEPLGTALKRIGRARRDRRALDGLPLADREAWPG
jgi:predicted DNA-binding WGR domain protein